MRLNNYVLLQQPDFIFIQIAQPFSGSIIVNDLPESALVTKYNTMPRRETVASTIPSLPLVNIIVNHMSSRLKHDNLTILKIL